MSNAPPAEPAEERKASWPLIVLALLSFIPSFGLLFAAIAISWGLLSDRPRARLAVVLGAIGAALTFVEFGILLYKFQGTSYMTDAQATVARADLGKIIGALEDYRLRNGEYPPDLKTLAYRSMPRRIFNINDQTAGIFHQRPYQYDLHDDGTYDVFGVGPDGRPGTPDDVRATISDSLAARSGYRPPAAPDSGRDSRSSRTP